MFNLQVPENTTGNGMGKAMTLAWEQYGNPK